MTTILRKLSAEDVDTRSILIEKSRWRHFPPPMREFVVTVGGRAYPTRIVAEDCACVPPPHQHYHLEAGHFSDMLDFRKGAVIEIDVVDGAYSLRDA